MSCETAKERVTTVPSKSGLPTYFRFGETQCASCGLSPTLGQATVASGSQTKLGASERSLVPGAEEERLVHTDTVPVN